MESITKVNDDIYRLTLPYKDIFTTVYTIHTDRGFMLFDAASYDSDPEQYILPFLREIGITQNDLKYIFISHKHTDHAGGLPKLMEFFPDACIVSRSDTLKEEFKNSQFIIPVDGQIIMDILQVVTIPGHTKDSAAILDTRSGTMISGDCFQLYGIFGSGDWAANITLPAQHMKAVEKVRSMDIRCIVTAHDYHPYGFRYCGKEAISRALDACLAPLMQIHDLIAHNPTLDDLQIRALYNGAGNLPTVRASVVTAMRKMMDEERSDV